MRDPTVIQAVLESWKPLLADVRHVAPSAIVGGGAIRDLFLGGEIKDIDMFVPLGESRGNGPESFSLDWSVKTQILPVGYQGVMRDEVYGVVEYRHVGHNLPIQIIHLELPSEGFGEAALSRMDFDACRMSWNGNAIAGLEVLREVERTKTFTLLHCEDEKQAGRSVTRAGRFKQRYPDYTMDVSAAHRMLT